MKNSINNDDTAIELLQKINSRMNEIDATVGAEVLKRKQMEDMQNNNSNNGGKDLNQVQFLIKKY